MIRSKHEVLYLLNHGQTLAKQFVVAKTPPHAVETVYYMVPSSRVVERRLAEELLGGVYDDKVVPVAEGLFGAETAQQWELK